MVAQPQIDPYSFAHEIAGNVSLDVLDTIIAEYDQLPERYQQDPIGFAKDKLNIAVTEDIGRMLESVRDNRITVVRSCTGPGKSHGAAVAAAWFYKAYPDSRVYTVANPYENQRILWGEISNIVEFNKDSLFQNDKIRDFHVERDKNKKDFITALSVPTSGTEAIKEGKFSGKHHVRMLFIVDEGDTSPDFVYRGIEGCMSGGILVRILILFNPRYEAGAPFRHERDGTANIIHLSAFNHPNVVTGEDVIPGAVNQPTTVQRINKWCRPLVEGEKITADCFELPDYLVGVATPHESGKFNYPPLQAGTYVVQEPAFHYMVLGQYPPQPAQQLISREWVNQARSRWDTYVAKNGEVPPFGVKPILGGDIAELGNDMNCRCLRYGGYVAPFLQWGGMDLEDSADRFEEEARASGTMISFFDGNGVGAGMAPKLQRKNLIVVGVKVQERPTEEVELGKFGILRDQLMWMVREWLKNDPGAMLPPDEELIQELLTPTYTVNNGYIRVMPKNPPRSKYGSSSSVVCMRELLKRSPNKFDALALTFAPGTYFFGDCDFHYGEKWNE